MMEVDDTNYFCRVYYEMKPTWVFYLGEIRQVTVLIFTRFDK
jgi:hypothetical protein